VGGLGCGWAKLNVVQKRWLCVSACTSFNFAKNSQTALPKIVCRLFVNPNVEV